MTWTHITDVESDSKPGRVYQIKQAPDGRIGCTCMAFRFKSGVKTCKHIEAWYGQTTRPLTLREDVATPRVSTVTVATETFTFVRALDLEE